MDASNKYTIFMNPLDYGNLSCYIYVMLRKAFTIIISVGFALLLVYVSISGDVEFTQEPVAIPQNHVSLEGVTFLRGFGIDGGYAIIEAENAYLDQNSNTMNLFNTDIVLKDGKNDLVAHSDRGLYVINVSLTTAGNVHGVWNGLTYVVDEGGTFVYDFATEKSVMGDNVTFHKETSYIKSTQMDYDGLTQQMLFTGDVEMFLAGEDE
jgi:hypothetical protein